MSSKSPDEAARVAGSGQAPRVWSIAQRFRAVYVVSTALLLALTAGFLYLALERNLDVRDHALLSSKVQVLRLLLRKEAGHADILRSEVEHEAMESALRYYIRILDERNQTLIETPDMSSYAPSALFGEPAPADAFEARRIDDYVRTHGTFLLLSVRSIADTAGGPRIRTVQVALDVSSDLALLADYRRVLAAVLALGVASAMLMGGWLARRSTRPLHEITRSAQDITAARLDERITVSDWPSELVALAAAFNAMLDRLEESFTRLSQFSGDLAHALRTPLGNLRGEAEVALARGRTPEEYRHVLISGIEEYERLSRMVDGLLFIARSDDPNAIVERVRFDATREIEDVREFYQPLAAEQGVAIACEGNGWMVGDRMLFRRAITNLVGNALQHTPADGSVTVSLHPQSDGGFEVSVRDTGLGIEPEHLPMIFDRFFRTERSRASVPGGSGLGLAIVRSIMRLHGGTVSAVSELGRGTTVTLRFPPGPKPASAV